MSTKIKHYCQFCPKSYVSRAWYEKHLQNCNKISRIKFSEKNSSVISGDLLPHVFNFSEEFFSKKFFIPSYSNYLDELKDFCSQYENNLNILQLNVNFAFS